MNKLDELQVAGDWLGLASLDLSALALARELRGTSPGNAGVILSMIGVGFQETGEYGRARELHEQCKAIFEALGDHSRVKED